MSIVIKHIWIIFLYNGLTLAILQLLEKITIATASLKIRTRGAIYVSTVLLDILSKPELSVFFKLLMAT